MPRSSRLLTSFALAMGAVLAASAADDAQARPANRRQAKPIDETARVSLLPRRPTGRVVIVVSTDEQRLTVYDDGAPVATSTVSTGVADHPTPHGVFSIIEKQRFHQSNIYSAAPMPFMQRITWSGVALHEGHVTGRPASHGCIRLPHAFAVELFRFTREGARVIVAREDVSPSYSGTPFADVRSTMRPVEVAAAEAASGRFDGEIEPTAPVTTATLPAKAGRRDLVADYPVSILVSRKAGKLYVRRAFKPLFEVPVAIDEPSRPLGTHLFMARGAALFDWSSMTLATPVREVSLIDETGRRNRRMRDTPPVALPPSDASEALSRVHLAPGTAAQISRLLSNGATLILSDDGARNRETWAGTDFIALSE